MQYMEAMQALKDGKMIVRECWDDSNGYLKLMYGMPYVWRVIINPANAGSFSFSMDEICADDWVLFPKEVKECPPLRDNVEL